MSFALESSKVYIYILEICIKIWRKISWQKLP
jgi:hypothetical protein